MADKGDFKRSWGPFSPSDHLMVDEPIRKVKGHWRLGQIVAAVVCPKRLAILWRWREFGSDLLPKFDLRHVESSGDRMLAVCNASRFDSKDVRELLGNQCDVTNLALLGELMPGLQ